MLRTGNDNCDGNNRREAAEDVTDEGLCNSQSENDCPRSEQHDQDTEDGAKDDSSRDSFDDGALWICSYLLRHYPAEYLKVAKDAGVPTMRRLTAIETAALIA